jgi:amino acid adenylation domain-containing protein
VEELQPERDLSRNPLVQVFFQLLSEAEDRLALRDLTVTRLPSTIRSVRFDLELHLLKVGESLNGMIVYSTDLFDSATIERMVGHFHRLLEGLAGDISSRVSALPLVTDRERVQILQEWNATESEYPSASSVHELFELQVERSSDSIALTFGEQRLSYRELNERSNQLAHRLLREGVERGSFVAIFLERTQDSVVATLGILKAGCVYVPVDVAYPRQRVEFMLGDASVRVVVTHSSHVSALPVVDCSILCVDSVASEALPGDVKNPDRLCCGDDVAYVMYTSGSTGNPKGVIVPHRGIVRLILNTDYVELHAEDCIAHTTNIAFDVATFEIWGALLRGGTLAIASHDVVLSSAGFGEFLDRERVTTVCMTPSLFKLHVNWNPEIFGKIKQVLLAGEVMDPVVVRQCLSGKPPKRLLNVYGPTENTTYSTWYLVDGWPEDSIPIGKPICNSQAYVVDGHDQLQPVGVVGELCVAGPGLALGYLNRPDLTALRFVRNPYSAVAGDLMYRTGDLCRWRGDGCLEFLGRMDDQVKLRGIRIELGEIESALQLHPSVSQSVVIVREDSAGEQRLVGYVVWRTGLEVSVSELRDHLRVRLPEYMVPARIVEISELPLTSSGKLNRRGLPVPADVGVEFSDRYEAARTSTEEQMVGIWREVLKIDRVGVHDNFFGLGGHSLLATRVIARISAALGVELPLRRIFEYPTIAELARALREVPQSVESASQNNAVSSAVRASNSGWHVVCVSGSVHPLLRSIDAEAGIIYLGREDLSGPDVPEVAIEDLADQFAAELLRLEVCGPLVLVGFSFHGAVTLALVERLRLRSKQRIVAVALEPSLPEIPRPRLTQLAVRGRQLISRTMSRAGKLYRRGPGGLMHSLRARLSQSGAVVRGPLDEHEYVSQATPGLIRSIQKFRPGKTAFGDIYLVGGQPYLDQYLERFQTLICEAPQVLNLGDVAHMDVYNEEACHVKWLGLINQILKDGRMVVAE